MSAEIPPGNALDDLPDSVVSGAYYAARELPLVIRLVPLLRTRVPVPWMPINLARVAVTVAITRRERQRVIERAPGHGSQGSPGGAGTRRGHAVANCGSLGEATH